MTPRIEPLRAVKQYVTPTLTVKATRQHRGRRNARQITMLLTIGQPNYLERKFIKQARRAGVAFPVRKVQVKAYAD